MARRDVDDRGSVLMLTLILTVVLGLVVVALATFATTGLSTTSITTDRTESNVTADGALTWFLEELAADRYDPEVVCDPFESPPAPISYTAPQPVPSDVLPLGGSSATLMCALLPEIDHHPTVRLTAVGVTASGAAQTVMAVVQVPRDEPRVHVRTWDAAG